jgi:hypothetical protein
MRIATSGAFGAREANRMKMEKIAATLEAQMAGTTKVAFGRGLFAANILKPNVLMVVN